MPNTTKRLFNFDMERVTGLKSRRAVPDSGSAGENLESDSLRNYNPREENIESPFQEEYFLPEDAQYAYALSYTFVVIPRFRTHHLIGDLARSLEPWVQDICISHAWRLEILTIRPEYMQLSVSVLPTTTPGAFINQICRHTSKQIFEDFPRFQRENVSREFWAPSFFFMQGIHPAIDASMVEEFIVSTREKQGFSSARGT